MISESINTGICPFQTIEYKGEIIVNEGTIISSFFFKSSALIAISKAAEPLQTAVPYFFPIYLENSFSNESIKDPLLEIHPVSIHSLTYFFSFPSRKSYYWYHIYFILICFWKTFKKFI